MKNRKTIFNTILLFILLLTIIGVFLSCSGKKMNNKESQNLSESQVAKKQYVCSMHPKVIQDKPGD